MSTSSRPSSSSSSTSGPLLGSAYLTSQSLIPPASPNDLSQSVCLNISLFKSTIKKYRALDDAITTRLNRDAALHRGDPSTSTGKDGLPVLDVNEAAQGQTCLRIWQDMIESWKRRERIIRHCVSSTEERMKSRERELDALPDQDYDKLDAQRKDRVRDDLFSEQVKRQQLHNELSVESIIRRRTLAAFFSRCPQFQPPADPDGGPAVPQVDLEPMPFRPRPINN